MDFDPGSGALGGRPPGRRRELFKVSITTKQTYNGSLLSFIDCRGVKISKCGGGGGGG